MRLILPPYSLKLAASLGDWQFGGANCTLQRLITKTEQRQCTAEGLTSGGREHGACAERSGESDCTCSQRLSAAQRARAAAAA